MSRSHPRAGGAGGNRARGIRNAILLAGLLVAAIIGSLSLGSVPIPPADAVGVVLHHVTRGWLASNECPVQATDQGVNVPCSSVDTIVWTIWMPEVLLAALVGAGLALAGGTMQGIFRNPLGDPYLLGISSGAALGAALVLASGAWLWEGGLTTLLLAHADYTMPLFAFVGAMGSSLLVLLASRSSRASPEILLLTGVALGAFVAALLALIITFEGPLTNMALSFWILGGFALATWSIVGVVFLGVASGGVLLALHGRDLNVLQLGDETAKGLGVDVKNVRTRLLLLASLVTAVCVAFSGIIGFVGLVSPHVVRRLQGPSYKTLLPSSALFGSLFMVLAFDIAQTIVGNGTVLPVGVITSFVGGPFFLWILYRRRGPA